MIVPGMAERILELKQLSYQYPTADKMIIDQLDLSLHRKERIGIMAPNGSGKTTLFFLIMGLLAPFNGSIEAFGKPIEKEKDFQWLRKKIGLLFQDSDDQLFSPTVLEDVAFGPLNLKKTRGEAIAIAKETLNLLGLNGFENRITHRLSGGEKRLVALATILSMKPEVLLLDEPSNGLDENTRERLVDVLKKLDLTYLIISHDREFLSTVTQECCTLANGRLHRSP